MKPHRSQQNQRRKRVKSRLKKKKKNNDSAKVLRTCVTCRGKFEKTTLLRFIWDGSNPIPDETQRGAGRGGYCCINQQCRDRFERNPRKWSQVFRLKEKTALGGKTGTR
ncbi:MAG: YlxR family protein [Desulfobulbaceae bacterium]|nr:MAG: YlxR family protein [Desulfobulbaceae bacterium]